MSRVERKKDETKEKIINAAMALFRKQGFDATTVEEIAENADVAYKTVFNHFPVKEDIIMGYLNRKIKASDTEILNFLSQIPDTRTGLITAWRSTGEWAETVLTRDLYTKSIAYRLRNINAVRRDPSLRAGFQITLVKIFQQGQEKGEIRNDLSCEILANQLELIMYVDLLDDPDQFLSGGVIERNVDLILKGAEKRND